MLPLVARATTASRWRALRTPSNHSHPPVELHPGHGTLAEVLALHPLDLADRPQGVTQLGVADVTAAVLADAQVAEGLGR